ncbi:MAG TPA: hypothetical protein VH331_13715 [Allosphingosinicella sp.]|nr:hypothetical protein [Allosphingosinicella sp.]
MEGGGATILLGGAIATVLVVLIGPPLLFALHRQIRHRRGRWFHRSTRRSRH